MSKVLRLFADGADTIKDWGKEQGFPYDSNNRSKIQDPDGAKASHEITSIPSPFARIDIAKNAFREVVARAKKEGKISGKTIYHKTVSDVLDIAEIFFNYDKLKDKVEIMVWNPESAFERLHDGKSGHEYLATALKTYWEADEKTYNFDQVRDIYLLNYKGPGAPHEVNIIGATSPATLFFSSANDLSYVSENICFGNDRPFDGDYCQLSERSDEDFVLYLYSLRKDGKFEGEFATLFPEVNDYLDEVYKSLSDVMKNKIKNRQYPSTAALQVVGEGVNNMVEIVGERFEMRKVEPVSDSDFEMRGAREGLPTPLPLILPVESGSTYASFKYTTAQWGTENKAPEQDATPIGERTLPFDGRRQAYMTLDDFLERDIVRVNHRLNDECYVNALGKPCKQVRGEDVSYLLPLKDTFFEYFDADVLTAKGSSEVRLEIKPSNTDDNIVDVELTLPIRGKGNTRTITYKRLYQQGSDTYRIITIDFEAFVMPPVRTQEEKASYYTIGQISETAKPIQLDIRKEAKSLLQEKNLKGNVKEYNGWKFESFTLEESYFDYIRISSQEHSCGGVIVPRFKKAQATYKFDFAVDLGTSNTHIEYKKYDSTSSGVSPVGLAYDESEEILAPVFVRTDKNKANQLLNEYNMLETQMIPMNFGTGQLCQFPARTILTKYREIPDENAELHPHEYTLAALAYEKVVSSLDGGNTTLSNIKWDDGTKGDNLRYYIESLVLLMRNKALMNEADPQEIYLCWFYPNSMPPVRVGKLKKIWKEATEKYLGTSKNVRDMSEAVAPLLFVERMHASANNLINMDIGGGTTDISFKMDGRKALTSFQFAGNTLFEDQLAPTNLSNGIVDCYRKEFEKMIDEGKSDYSQLKSFFEDENHQAPANMAAFLFSLKDHQLLEDVKAKKKDFISILSDDDEFRIVFILYYGAMIYHIGKIIKHNGFSLPRHLSFSGNGSRILRAITEDEDILTRFTKTLLEEVTGQKYDANGLELVGFDGKSSPKESTCKGALVGDLRKPSSAEKIEDKLIECPNAATDGEVSMGFEEITDETRKEVIGEVEQMFDLLLNTFPKEKFSYEGQFGIDGDCVEIAQKVSKQDLDNFLKKGIEKMQKDCDGGKLEETLFFVPIKGVLSKLSTEIYKKKTS